MDVLNLSIGGPDYLDLPFVEKVCPWSKQFSELFHLVKTNLKNMLIFIFFGFMIGDGYLIVIYVPWVYYLGT